MGEETGAACQQPRTRQKIGEIIETVQRQYVGRMRPIVRAGDEPEVQLME